MKLAVISDLHLGRGDEADAFGHDDAQFVRFLRFLEAEHERVVLLGDVWETLAAPRGRARLDELRAVREAHPEIARRLDRPTYTHIVGNHDPDAARAFGALPELTLEADGLKLLFTHGHHHDWVIRRLPRFAEWCSWFGLWLRRVGLLALFQLLDGLDGLVNRTRGEGLGSFERWALALAQHRAADVVVTGHTHRGGRHDADHALYLNSGTCTGGAWSFTSIDTRAATFGYHTTW